MKKILFLTESFPDTRKSASTLCTHRVMEAFANNAEYEVHCLCSKYPDEEKIDYQNCIHIHRFERSFFTRIKYRCYIGSNRIFKLLFQCLVMLQKLIAIPFYPCTNPIMLRRWKTQVKKLHQSESFDIIIAEHHGYETLIAGCWIKKKIPQLLSIPILWDPVLGQIATKHLPNSFVKKCIEKEEQYLIKYSDYIISMRSMKNFYDNYGDYALSKRLYLDIPGILYPDELIPTKYDSVIEPEYVNILYSGLIIIPQRDPSKIINLLNKVSISKKINLIFFCAGNAQSKLNELRKQFLGKIKIYNYIPLQELHSLYKKVDYLLNISDINADMTPSKIFEYMSYGKPIISTYVTPGDAAEKYLVKYPEACIINLNDDIIENIKSLNNFFKKEHRTISFEEVHKEFINNTPQIYVETITNIYNNFYNRK